MSTWSLCDSEGRKIAQFTGREIDAALNVPTGGEMIAGDFDENEVYWNGATLAPRPALNIPAQHTVPVNTDWTLTDIPAGTEVLIDGATVATTDGSDLDLSFPEAGPWDLELRPPFPWRDAACEVMVE